MADQAGGPRQQRDALQRFQRKADIEHHGRYSAIDIDRQRPADDIGQTLLNRIKRGDVLAAGDPQGGCACFVESISADAADAYALITDWASEATDEMKEAGAACFPEIQ